MADKLESKRGQTARQPADMTPRVEVGSGEAPAKIALQRSRTPQVEIGSAGAPPKIALLRGKARVEVGSGVAPPRVAQLRARSQA
jgi:hypothetical protein